MITVVSQDRTRILDVERLELMEINGVFHICQVCKISFTDFLFYKKHTFHSLAEYEYKRDAERVFKSFAAAIHNDYKIFILPSDSRLFIERCENLYYAKNEGNSAIWF